MTDEKALKRYNDVVIDYAASCMDGYAAPEVLKDRRENYELFKLGRDALRERIERSKGCEYCIDKNGVFCEKQDAEIEAFNFANDTSYMIYPNFCPICGRKLSPPKEDKP